MRVRRSSSRARVAFVSIALGLASRANHGSEANAQAAIKPLPRGVFVAYGLDALALRITAYGTPPAGFVPQAQAPASRSAYVTFEIRNDNRIAENIPSLQATLRLADGTVIDPAVYGPYVGTSRVEAPTTTTIAPHAKIVVHLVIGDVPAARAVESIVFNPNDATPAYRYRVGARPRP